MEECVSISRRESSASGVGGSYFIGGCILISRRGSMASGVGGHTSLGEGWILISRRGCFDFKEGSSSSYRGADY